MCIATKGFIQVIPSNRFQKLAEVTCPKLTAPLYMFMAVMQRVC
jgi:Fanconi anemia group I protein